MTTKLSCEAFVVLLVNTAIVTITAFSATTLTVLLLSEFNNAKFQDKDLKKGDELFYYFILCLCPALLYY